MNLGGRRTLEVAAIAAAALGGALLIRHAVVHGGNGIGYVAGVQLLVVAAIATILLIARERRRDTVGVAATAAVIVAALAIAVPAAARPGPLEQADLTLSELARDAEPFGAWILATHVTASFTGFATYNALSDSPTDVLLGDAAIVGADGSAFVFDRDGTITSIGNGGEDAWSVDVVEDDTAARLRPVAVLDDGSVVALTIPGDQDAEFELVAIDGRGEERWRVAVDRQLRFVDPTTLRQVAQAPSVVVAALEPDADGRSELYGFDPATGRRSTIASVDGFALGAGYVAVVVATGAECVLEILGPGFEPMQRIKRSCPDGDVFLSSTAGPVRMDVGDTTVLVDPASGEVEEFPTADVDIHPSGLIEESGGRFRPFGGDAVDYDGWSLVDAEDGMVVLRRDVGLANPFRHAGDDDRDELAIVDLGTGSICLRTVVAGWWVDAVALPACRAILNDSRSGTTWLIG